MRQGEKRLGWCKHCKRHWWQVFYGHTWRCAECGKDCE